MSWNWWWIPKIQNSREEWQSPRKQRNFWGIISMYQEAYWWNWQGYSMPAFLPAPLLYLIKANLVPGWNKSQSCGYKPLSGWREVQIKPNLLNMQRGIGHDAGANAEKCRKRCWFKAWCYIHAWVECCTYSGRNGELCMIGFYLELNFEGLSRSHCLNISLNPPQTIYITLTQIDGWLCVTAYQICIASLWRKNC